MRNLIFLFLLTISSLTFGQSLTIGSLVSNHQLKGSVKGIVLDKELNNNPLAFATISIEGANIEKESTIDGSFEFKLKPGSYNFIFSFIGYETVVVKDVKVSANSTTNLKQPLGALKLSTPNLTSLSE